MQVQGGHQPLWPGPGCAFRRACCSTSSEEIEEAESDGGWPNQRDIPMATFRRLSLSAYCLAHWVHRVPRCPPGRRRRGQAKTMQGNQPALQPKLALPQYHHILIPLKFGLTWRRRWRENVQRRSGQIGTRCEMLR